MKKELVVFVFIFQSIFLFGQNIQLHRDFGKDRNYFTSTVEMFKPDDWGNTFLFIDMNYNVGDVDGVSLAYWELARVIEVWEFPLGIHLEYDGGFGQWKEDTLGGAYQINSAYLAGVDYSWHNQDFTKGFSIKTMYKYIENKHDVSFQITAVWYMHFFNRKLTFKGFADFWREDNVFTNKETDYVFLSEPQIWYNAFNHLSIGSEVELSNNFGGIEGFHAMPTLAVKWTF